MFAPCKDQRKGGTRKGAVHTQIRADRCNRLAGCWTEKTGIFKHLIKVHLECTHARLHTTRTAWTLFNKLQTSTDIMDHGTYIDRHICTLPRCLLFSQVYDTCTCVSAFIIFPLYQGQTGLCTPYWPFHAVGSLPYCSSWQVFHFVLYHSEGLSTDCRAFDLQTLCDADLCCETPWIANVYEKCYVNKIDLTGNRTDVEIF